MLEDQDVIFVDFDDLFDPKLFEEQMSAHLDDEHLLKLLGEAEQEENNQQPLKKKRGPHPKLMTREQFYKIRPKMPKIPKADPRRQYAAAFAEAYNSCDFDKIWEFISTHSTPDAVFVHRWVGKEQYLNFPTFLSIKGWENISEYWFSRCVIVPDLVVELKETKLYVRSDGFSTVLSSFTINCTRLYDGLISHSLIVQAAAEIGDTTDNETRSVVEDSESGSRSSDESKVEIIPDRVMEKFDRILLGCEPLPGKKKNNKRKMSDEFSITSEPVTPMVATTTIKHDSPEITLNKKVIPSGTGITLLGTITMQLDQESKVKHYEMTFALKQ